MLNRKIQAGVNPYWMMAAAVVASCLMLFSLDKETHGIADLLTPGNLVALVLYALPTYIICLILFTLFNRAYSPGKSVVRALAIGIPTGIIIIMCFFWWKLGK